MIGGVVKSFAQLTDRRLSDVVIGGIASAALIHLGLIALAIWSVGHITFFDAHWADLGSAVGVVVAVIVLPGLFFPALATGVMGLWLDRVADAVEARHYPLSGPIRRQGWGEILSGSLRFMGAMIVANLVALPFYLLLLLTGFGFVLFYLVNGYLMAREFYDMVALRHLDPAQARLVFRQHLLRLWLAGAGIAFLFSIPGLNLIGPVVAVAWMTHLFQNLRKR